jgi:hypothetical protein
MADKCKKGEVFSQKLKKCISLKPPITQDKGHKLKWGFYQDAKTAGSYREDELPWGGMHTPEPQKSIGRKKKK